MVDELAVEAEVARQLHDDAVVLEPRDAVDDEPQRDLVDTGCARRADREVERADRARRHAQLRGRRDTISREPTHTDLRLCELRRIAGHTERDLGLRSPIPRDEAGVTEADRIGGGRAGEQRGRGPLLDELAVEGERQDVAGGAREQHDAGGKRSDDNDERDQPPYRERVSLRECLRGVRQPSPLSPSTHSDNDMKGRWAEGISFNRRYWDP